MEAKKEERRQRKADKEAAKAAGLEEDEGAVGAKVGKDAKESKLVKPGEDAKMADKKKIELKRMYRMFKKRRPFGWRELNDHFLWLSMMAQDEHRTRSLSPSCREYAKFRLIKKRARFGNRELISYSQTLINQGARTEEDLATLRDLESYYGNFSQLTISQEMSKFKDKAEAKEARMQQMLSDLYSEGAIGSYNQLESYQEFPDDKKGNKKKESESSNTSNDESDSNVNNNQRSSTQRRKRKRRKPRNFDNIA